MKFESVKEGSIFLWDDREWVKLRNGACILRDVVTVFDGVRDLADSIEKEMIEIFKRTYILATFMDGKDNGGNEPTTFKGFLNKYFIPLGNKKEELKAKPRLLTEEEFEENKDIIPPGSASYWISPDDLDEEKMNYRCRGKVIDDDLYREKEERPDTSIDSVLQRDEPFFSDWGIRPVIELTEQAEVIVVREQID